MSQKYTSTVETLEPTKLKLTVSVSPEAFREGITIAYNKNKQHFNIQGFRKGKAPRKMIEQLYGREVFYEDALNAVLQDAYEAALDEHDIEPVYRPEIEPGPASEAEGATFYAEIYIRPEAEVSDYYGLLYPETDTEPTEDEIHEALTREQEKGATQMSVERPAEMGDIVTINYKGYFGDEPFEGGEGFEHQLTLGSKQFIGNFEEQLVGHIPGDDVEVIVTFPEEYHHADYSGKEARFEVEVIDVQAKEMPELNDEFADNVSEYETLAEYRQDLADKIKKSKEQNFDNAKRNHVMRQLRDKATVDVPDAMHLARMEEMLREFEQRLQMQGMSMELYAQYTQMTPEKLMENWRPQAEIEVKNMLVLEAVAKKESLTVTEEELAEYIGKITGMKDEELAKIVENLPAFRRKEIMRSCVCDKAMDFVVEKAIATNEPMPEFAADGQEKEEE